VKVELIATTILVISMITVLLVVYSRTGSLLRAWIVSLIVGKTLALVYWCFGITHVIATIYIYNKLNHKVIPVQITSNLVIIVSFFTTMIVSLFWYDLVKLAPKSFRDKLKKAEVIR